MGTLGKVYIPVNPGEPTLFAHWDVVQASNDPFKKWDEDRAIQEMIDVHGACGMFPLLPNSKAVFDAEPVEGPSFEGRNMVSTKIILVSLCEFES